MWKDDIRVLNEDSETLSLLGLTSQQAKIYLILGQLEQASTAMLAHHAQIDRGQTYRVLSQLQEMGLIARIMTSPIEFRIISFKKGVKALFEAKRTELKEIENKAIQLCIKTKRSKPQSPDFEIEKLLFVPKTSSILSRVYKSIVDAQESIDGISTTERMMDPNLNVWEAATIKALKKGVKQRLLISATNSKENMNLDSIKNFVKFPSFNARITSETIAAPLAITDKKEAHIYISDTVNILSASVLMTTNRRLVQLCECHFNDLWKRAREY